MGNFTEPKDYRVLFLDMNSFFASVEQQVQPTLRGEPIGVAPFIGSSGCIIAASKEAKAMGVKIGRIGEMKKLCPRLKVVESRPALYMIYHKEIKKVIESFTPYFEPLSIDEFCIHLDRNEQNFNTAVRLGQRLKEAIKERVGDSLTCSVGIGPSYFLAKMAGERKKPDGLTAVRLSELKEFYSGLKLTDITGINYRMEAKLNFLNIKSPLEFFNSSLPDLRGKLGHPGRLWYFRLRGYEVDDFEVKNKTIGHSHVLPPEYRSIKGAMEILEKLIFKAGYRLRQEGYWASGVSVSISFYDKPGFHTSRKFEKFCDNITFLRNTKELLKGCYWGKQPSYVGVASFGLSRAMGEQISLLKEERKQREISKAMDLINDEFGPETIYPASMSNSACGAAPDRIPFGRPRKEIVF